MNGMEVKDTGDARGHRWCIDRENPRAMNIDKVVQLVKGLSEKVSDALKESGNLLILGGDCTIELGTVAGVLFASRNTGLIYIDLDIDLNTPESTDDGALDWMGVAHLIGLEGTMAELADSGPVSPMLSGSRLMYFGNANSLPFERSIIEGRNISETPLRVVSKDPESAAGTVTD